MKCVICGQPIEEGRKQGQLPLLAKYCLKCRAERRRRARLKYTWLPEHDAYLKAYYFGGLKRRFQVLTRMVRMTGLPRWYIKRQAARLGLTMKMDRRPWTEEDLDRLENLVGRVSSATIATIRPEPSDPLHMRACFLCRDTYRSGRSNSMIGSSRAGGAQ